MIFVFPAVNVTMTPDNASALRDSIKPRPSPNLHCTTPPRHNIIDVLQSKYLVGNNSNMSDLAPFHVNVEGKYIVEDDSLSRGWDII
jgi:hypothetical protein